MNDVEKYQFDLNGYLLVKGLLGLDDVRRCLVVADAMESHIATNIDAEPRLLGFANISHRFDEKYQCYSYKSTSGGGLQYVVDDFLNASEAFDPLVGHPPTMEYIEELSAGPHWISSSELRYRHKSNLTSSHMGGRMDSRNRYEFVGVKMFDSPSTSWRVRDFNLLSVRVLYALHDIPVENGPLCVVPGSHKSNYFSPFDDADPVNEPGMIPLPMQAGDAIIFTENLRHGGFPNSMDQVRKTLHLFYAPRWAGSQSPIHWDDKIYVSEQAWARYSETQRALLPPPASELPRKIKVLQEENRQLKGDNEKLKQENAALKARLTKPGVVSTLRKVIGG
jgi:hypothetical protein